MSLTTIFSGDKELRALESEIKDWSWEHFSQRLDTGEVLATNFWTMKESWPRKCVMIIHDKEEFQTFLNKSPNMPYFAAVPEALAKERSPLIAGECGI